MAETKDLVKAVHEHWILSGVDPDQADEMAVELTDHLHAAVADGKTTEAVVGADLLQFANDWAEPVIEPMNFASKVRLVAIGVLMFVISTVAIDGVFEGSAGVTVDPFFVAPAGVLGGLLAYAVVSPIGSRVSRQGVRSRRVDWLMWTVLFALFIAGWVWVSTTFESEWLIPVPAWFVVVAGLVTFVVMVFPFVTIMQRADRADSVVIRIVKFLFGFFV